MLYRSAREATLTLVRGVDLSILITIGTPKNVPFVGRERCSQSARYHHVSGVIEELDT